MNVGLLTESNRNPANRLLNLINCPGYPDRDRTAAGTDRVILIDLIEISALTGISHWHIRVIKDSDISLRNHYWRCSRQLSVIYWKSDGEEKQRDDG